MLGREKVTFSAIFEYYDVITVCYCCAEKGNASWESEPDDIIMQ